MYLYYVAELSALKRSDLIGSLSARIFLRTAKKDRLRYKGGLKGENRFNFDKNKAKMF